MSTPSQNLLERLEGVRGNGPKWEARCPGHDDRKPSLSVTEKATGDLLVFCHGPCGKDVGRILSPIGLSARDLFAESSSNGRDEEAVYRYLDEDGKPLFEVVRFTGKEFRQRLPDGTWGLNGARRVLYRLPKVLEAVKKGEDVVIVEREKDVHTLEKIGITATCNPGGAGKWRDEYSEVLRGAAVTVVADRDEPGREHARQVAESLQEVVTEIDVVEPISDKDISEHLAAGKGIGQLVPISVEVPGANPLSRTRGCGPH